jgi:hypothetical protein
VNEKRRNTAAWLTDKSRRAPRWMTGIKRLTIAIQDKDALHDYYLYYPLRVALFAGVLSFERVRLHAFPPDPSRA